jgi:hypothetical protein
VTQTLIKWPLGRGAIVVEVRQCACGCGGYEFVRTTVAKARSLRAGKDVDCG